jgi:hypothetical protein
MNSDRADLPSSHAACNCSSTCLSIPELVNAWATSRQPVCHAASDDRYATDWKHCIRGEADAFRVAFYGLESQDFRIEELPYTLARSKVQDCCGGGGGLANLPLARLSTALVSHFRGKAPFTVISWGHDNFTILGASATGTVSVAVYIGARGKLRLQKLPEGIGGTVSTYAKLILQSGGSSETEIRPFATSPVDPQTVVVPENEVMPVEFQTHLTLQVQPGVPFRLSYGLQLEGAGGGFIEMKSSPLKFVLPSGATIVSEAGYGSPGPQLSVCNKPQRTPTPPA